MAIFSSKNMNNIADYINNFHGDIAFQNPLLLLLLLLILALFLFFLFTPPRKRNAIGFSSLFLLQKAQARQKTQQKQSSLLILLLRIAFLAAIAIAASEPYVKSPFQQNKQPILVIDNGWYNAPIWQNIQQYAVNYIQQLRFEDQKLTIITTATNNQQKLSQQFSNQDIAINYIKQLQPYNINLNLNIDNQQPIDWLGSELSFTHQQFNNDNIRYHLIAHNQPLDVIENLSLKDNILNMRVTRFKNNQTQPLLIIVNDSDNNIIASFPIADNIQNNSIDVTLPLSPQIISQASHIAIAEQYHIGAVALLPKQAQDLRIGLMRGINQQISQQLNDGAMVLQKLLSPTHDIFPIKTNDKNFKDIKQIIMSDSTLLNDDEMNNLLQWIDDGGVLMRFSGDNLHNQHAPALMTGTLNTQNPILHYHGAFAGEAKIDALSYQELTQQTNSNILPNIAIRELINLNHLTLSQDNILLKLQDGTPLITIKKIGKGHVILYHFQAIADGSDFILSQDMAVIITNLLNKYRLHENLINELVITNIKQTHAIDKILSHDGVLGNGDNINIQQDVNRYYAGYFYDEFGHIFTTNHFQLARNLPIDPKNDDTQSYNNLANQKNIPIISHYFWFIAMMLLLCEWILLFIPQIPTMFKNIITPMLALLFFTGLFYAPPIYAQTSDRNNSYFGYLPSGNTTLDNILESNLNIVLQQLNKNSTINIKQFKPLNLEDNFNEYFLIVMFLHDNIPSVMQQKIMSYAQTGGSLLMLYDSGKNKKEMAEIAQKLSLPILSPVEKDDVILRSFYLLTMDKLKQNLPFLIWRGGFSLNNIDDIPQFILSDVNLLLNPDIFNNKFTRQLLMNNMMMVLAGQYKNDALHDAVIRARRKNNIGTTRLNKAK